MRLKGAKEDAGEVSKRVGLPGSFMQSTDIWQALPSETLGKDATKFKEWV